MHLRASFNNGVTRDELKRADRTCAVLRAAGGQCHSMHLAQQVFDDIDAAQG